MLAILPTVPITLEEDRQTTLTKQKQMKKGRDESDSSKARGMKLIKGYLGFRLGSLNSDR